MDGLAFWWLASCGTCICTISAYNLLGLFVSLTSTLGVLDTNWGRHDHMVDGYTTYEISAYQH
jgi:hypothetical protein